MIHRWLVYDRQDSVYRLISNLNYNAQTSPKVIFEQLIGRQRIETHTARLWRYVLLGFHHFRDNTTFPESFATLPEAWSWYSKHISPDSSNLTSFISPPQEPDEHFHAPAVVEETVRRIVINPKDNTHWVRIKHVNFPIEDGTPVRIFGKKNSRFSCEEKPGEFCVQLSNLWNKPTAYLEKPSVIMVLQDDDLVQYGNNL